jgi:GAG-pre-integrase domain
MHDELDMEEGEIISNNTRPIPTHHVSALRNAEKQKLEAELLLYHHRLGHVSFSKLQDMARLGMIPKRLSNVLFPLCPSCIYGKLSRKPWRNKQDYRPISDTKIPGHFVSVDQLESTTPGLKGIPTRERYYYATIFLDHATDYTYVHLQRDTSSEETLRAKKEF